MALVLKGIEIENFKSYAEKQYIHFSDLSVLLGANSSGKSTALQALLIMKQTIECNSPDEVENDEFRIAWYFKRADDGISATLIRLDIIYENLILSFKRADNIHYMYINEKRSPFSAIISNLMMVKYYIHRLK